MSFDNIGGGKASRRFATVKTNCSWLFKKKKIYITM
jgi:hypothetical protein